MTNKQIKDFADIGVPADADEILINDTTGDITKKVTVANLQSLSRDTGSNVGTGGIGVYKQKTGTVFEFKNINSASSKIAVTNDITDSEIDIDVVEANVIHQNINGAGTNTHAQIDDKLLVVQNNSQGWENSETTVNNNSTSWENAELTVNTNSLGWQNTTTTVDNNSSNWNTAYTHSQNNTQAHTDYLINNGNDTSSGSLSVNSLEIDGTEVISNFLNLSINNITASGTITGEISDVTFGDITVSTANITGAATSLTVTNNISAGGTVLGSNLNIADWDNVNTTIGNNSTGWETAESVLNSNSQGWVNAESVLNTNSLGWETAESTLNSNSTGWVNAETTLSNNSTGWENAESALNTNSAGWESAESTVNNTSTNWQTAYTHSQDNSQAHSDYLINNGNDTTSGHIVATGNITTAPSMMGVDSGVSDAGTVVLRDSNGSDYYKLQVLNGAFTVTKI